MQNNKNNTYSQLIKLQKVLIQNNIPFVSYKLPLEDRIMTLIQHHSFPIKVQYMDLHDEMSGFIVSPFINDDKTSTYLLQPDCVFFSNEIEDVFIEKLANNNRFIHLKKTITATQETTSYQEFTDNVRNAVDKMNVGEFHKVVLSKIRKELLPDDFEAVNFFQKLCSKYPHAMVYMLQIPEVGRWLGATPEPLVEMENRKISTVSLAGTQIATGKDVGEYNWSEKEIEEQGIVTNYVEDVLAQLGTRSIVKTGPYNYQAANLIHLKTEFKFSSSNIDTVLGEFLQALHPTPSVGGLPKQTATDFIVRNEKHDRSYYTGFLGPVEINGKTDIFVNLRCLQLFDKEFVLYSGAGITTSSIAEKEWEETDNKMMTMMSVMNER